MSVVVTGIGVMTISEKIAMAGLLLGALSLARAAAPWQDGTGAKAP